MMLNLNKLLTNIMLGVYLTIVGETGNQLYVEITHYQMFLGASIVATLTYCIHGKKKNKNGQT